MHASLAQVQCVNIDVILRCAITPFCYHLCTMTYAGLLLKVFDCVPVYLTCTHTQVTIDDIY